MLTAEITEGVPLDDLKELDPLDAAIKAQKEYNTLDAEMKIVKARRAFTRTQLIAQMEASGRTDDGNDGGKVKLIKSLVNKVEDKEALLTHVYELDEPVSTYLEEVFKKGNKSKGIPDPLDRLVKEAAEKALATGKSVQECLPPGLSVRSIVSIRLTLSKGGEEKELTPQEQIMQQIDKELES